VSHRFGAQKKPAVIITAGQSSVGLVPVAPLLTTVNPVVDMLSATVKSSMGTPALVVQPLIDTVAFAIQLTVDAVAFSVQPVG
jgi:hypothetical protein